MTAPWNSTLTSQQAAESMEPHLARLEARVLKCIRFETWGHERIVSGLTDKEGEVLTGLSHKTYSARRRALVQKGLVRETNVRRLTPSGRSAIVWKAT